MSSETAPIIYEISGPPWNESPSYGTGPLTTREEHRRRGVLEHPGTPRVQGFRAGRESYRPGEGRTKGEIATTATPGSFRDRSHHLWERSRTAITVPRQAFSPFPVASLKNVTETSAPGTTFNQLQFRQ